MVHGRIIKATALVLFLACLLFSGLYVATDSEANAVAETHSDEASDWHVQSDSSQIGNGIGIDSVSYDAATGMMHVKGSTHTTLVNAYVLSDGVPSVIDAIVADQNGGFDDTFYVGTLPNGTHSLVVTGQGIKIVKEFIVGGNITIESASYSGGVLSFRVSGVYGLVNVYLKGDDYQSPIDAFIVKTGELEGSFYVGELKEGTYTLKVVSDRASGEYPLTVGSGGIPSGTELSEDGTVLIRYTGTTSEYRLPDSVQVVSYGAFSNCSIEKFILDRNVEWITMPPGSESFQYMFENAGVKEIEIEDGVEEIPIYLFAKTSIETIVIPSSVSTIGIKAFYNCDNLKKIEFSKNSQISQIDNFAFSSNVKLESIKFNSSAVGCSCNIGKGAFFNNSILKELFIDENFNLVGIGDFAFAKFNYLDTHYNGVKINSDSGMIIPASVQSIGCGAFSYLKNIGPAWMEPGKYTISSDVYQYPALSKSEYVIIDLGEGSKISFAEGSMLHTLGAYAFAGIKEFSMVDLSNCNNLESVGDSVFRASLATDVKVIWPNALKNIGKYSFYTINPIGEKTVTTVPKTVETIGNCGVRFSEVTNFEKGSLLKSIESDTYSSFFMIDLSECYHLQYIDSISEMKLPVAVFKTHSSMFTNSVDPSTPIAKVENGILKIEKDTVALVTLTLKNEITGIECSPDNKYFSIENGFLMFKGPVDNVPRLIYVQSESSSLVVEGDEGIIIGSDVIGKRIEELILGRNVVLSSDSVTSDSNLKTVTIGYELRDYALIECLNVNSNRIQFNVMEGTSDDCLKRMSEIGEVYIGYSMGGKTVFVPRTYEGSEIQFSMKSVDGSIEATISGAGGTVPFGIGCTVEVRDGSLFISSFTQDYSKIILVPIDHSQNDLISVTFDGMGGSSDGKGVIELSIHSGALLKDSDIPFFIRNLYDFKGWASSEDGTGNFDLTEPIKNSIRLYATWEKRSPLIDVDESAGRISYSQDSGGYKFNLVEVYESYVVYNWTINGEETNKAADQSLVLDIKDDVRIGVTYTYHSSSSGLDAISNRDLPSPDEVLSLVKSYELGGFLDKSGEIWKGHASVPLIVDNTVYFRAGPYLYSAESDTGYITKSVKSVEPNNYYHFLGYGAGTIIDYMTGKAYDLNLNQIYQLPSNIKISGLEYAGGYFYTSGDMVYRFTAKDENQNSATEVKDLKFIAKIDGTYGSYGFTSSIFVGGYMYRIIVQGDNRGVAALDLSTGEVSKVWLDSLKTLMLDDGWISYHDNIIYLTGYYRGLFNSTASPVETNSKLAYVHVNGGEFGNQGYYEFESQQFTSQFVVVNDVGYVNCGTTLYAFDMKSGISNPRTVESSFGHGSISIDVTDLECEGSPVYIYMIPYQSTSDSSFCLIEDREQNGQRVMTRHSVSYLPYNYNSQTVRADLDGRMIWYNDSGHIFTYTTPEKNSYFFFIGDGINGIWYEQYGRTAADALRSLGNDVVTLGDALNIDSLNGEILEDVGIWMLDRNVNETKIVDMKSYSWKKINDFINPAVNSNHYFFICSDPSVSPFTDGTMMKYLDGGVKDYSFKMNIGDRDIIGKELVRGSKVSTIKFYDDENKLVEETLGAVGKEVKRAFPHVIKSGYMPQWKEKDSGKIIDSLEGQVLSESGNEYTLSWVPFDADCSIDAHLTQNSENNELKYVIKGKSEGISISMDVFILYDDGRIILKTIDAVDTQGIMDVPSGSIRSCYLKLYAPGQSDDVIANIGNAVVAGVTA